MLPYSVMSFDNALLCGILLPSERWSNWKVVGGLILAIQFTQFLLIECAEHVLRVPFFMLCAAFVLAWVSVQTMIAVSWTTRSVQASKAFFRTYAFTVVGNLDDVLWIGGKIGGKFLESGFLAAASVPLTVLTVLVFVDLYQYHRWLLAVASISTAFASSELYLKTDLSKWIGTWVPMWGNQLLFVALIMLIGVLGLFAKTAAMRD